MTRLHVFRGVAATIAAAFAVAACGSTSTNTGPTNLADPSAQVLNFPIISDVGTLDPGHVNAAADITFTNEMFNGLYKFDNNLKIVNDIATGPPDVSADGLTYTFHLRSGVKFWNGDPVTASDFVYSWNRAAYLNDAYATVFQPVVGFDQVTATPAPTAKTMSGLTAPDDHTIVAKLTSPAGYWLTELALWTADVVDQKVIGDYTDKNNPNEDTWWTQPATAVGTGPFKMVARTAKVSVEFKPVAGWWGGDTGHLTDVMATVLADQASQVQKYNAGGFNIIGPANNQPDLADILAFQNNPAKKSQVQIIPAARTTWVGFNFIKGPLAGSASNAVVGAGDVTASTTTDGGIGGRTALALAIDRAALTSVACSDVICTPATGGVISKGLAGYLGDGTDTTAKFNKDQAKSTYDQWDPNHTKLAGQVFWYNTSSANDAWAQNVVAQWKANLGIDVTVQSTDRATFFKRRQNKEYTFFRDSWGADYNHPQDWFDNLFTCAAGAIGHGGNDGYCNKTVDNLVAQADAKQLNDALPLYQQAQQQMIKDVEFAALFYGTTPYFISPKVQGAGANSLYDYRWEPVNGSSGVYITK